MDRYVVQVIAVADVAELDPLAAFEIVAVVVDASAAPWAQFSVSDSV